MTILNDRAIRELVELYNFLSPFDEGQLNPFGYDLLLSNKFLLPNLSLDFIDTMKISEVAERMFIPFEGESVVIPPGSFALGSSIEKIRMPSNLTGLCTGRSSYARCGIVPNVTPLEAGWIGQLTIEISNLSRIPVRIHAYKGIVQVIFFEGDMPERNYSTKGNARYQNQVGPTASKGI